MASYTEIVSDIITIINIWFIVGCWVIVIKSFKILEFREAYA